MDGNKHYIRLDENNIVIFGFSTAFPEIATVQEGDICIDEDAPRQFQLAITNEDINNMQFIYKYVNGQMVLRTDADMFDLVQYKQVKIDLLSATCKSEILSNFTSNALGTVHSYGFEADDQTNLGGSLGAINASLCPPSFDWRTKDAGSLPHTIAQFKVLFTDGMIHKQTNIYKYWTLKSQVEACTDKVSVDAIVW